MELELENGNLLPWWPDEQNKISTFGCQPLHASFLNEPVSFSGKIMNCVYWHESAEKIAKQDNIPMIWPYVSGF